MVGHKKAEYSFLYGFNTYSVYLGVFSMLYNVSVLSFLSYLPRHVSRRPSTLIRPCAIMLSVSMVAASVINLRTEYEWLARLHIVLGI